MFICTCSKGFVGVTQYLRGLCQADDFIFVEEDKIIKKIESNKDTNTKLILGGFSNSYARIMDRAFKNDMPIYLTWHSPILQTELSEETMQLEWIIRLVNTGQIRGIIVSDPRLEDSLSSVTGKDKIIFLPHAIDLKELSIYRGFQKIYISAFGPNHPRKNRLVHLYVLHELTNRYNRETITNFNIPDTGYLKVKNRMPFMSRSEILRLIGQTRIGLCVTLSESFNYNLWEYLAFGGVVITTYEQKEYLSKIILRTCNDFKKSQPFHESVFVVEQNNIESIVILAENIFRTERNKEKEEKLIEFVSYYNDNAVSFINTEATKKLN